MNRKLKNITDTTINQLLNQDIIMPSQYYKTFDKNAKNIDLYIHDENFEQDISEVIEKEFEKINQYMNETIHNIDMLSDVTHDAEIAIEKKDKQELIKINNHIKTLKDQITSLQDEIYQDDLTKLYNKKYIKMRFLNEKDSFKKNGSMVLVNINNFSKINKRYGELIGDNVLIYTSNFIKKKLQKEHIDCEFIRYGGDKFIIFFKNHNAQTLNTLFNNIRYELLNSTIKSKSGHIISIAFSYAALDYEKQDYFYSTLLHADDLVKEDKFTLKNQVF